MRRSAWDCRRGRGLDTCRRKRLWRHSRLYIRITAFRAVCPGNTGDLNRRFFAHDELNAHFGANLGFLLDRARSFSALRRADSLISSYFGAIIRNCSGSGRVTRSVAIGGGQWQALRRRRGGARQCHFKPCVNQNRPRNRCNEPRHRRTASPSRLKTPIVYLR